MVAVRVMQVAIDQIIDVVAVRHRFVAAARAVPMALGVALATVLRRAGSRVRGTDGQHVLLDVAATGVVQVAIVQVIDVPFVNNAGVAAVRPVDVIGRMGAAVVLGCASRGIRGGHGEHVLVDMTIVRMVQVVIVQIIDVPLVANGLMSARLAVLVSVVGMCAMVVGHDVLL